MMDQDTKKRAKAQRERIIEVLKEAGAKGCTNIVLSDYITKSLGARLSELYERGYYIECTKIKSGVYNYVLISEPDENFKKAMRAEDVLLEQIIEGYNGKISVHDLKDLLTKNDMIISRKAGAHKRRIS